MKNKNYIDRLRSSTSSELVSEYGNGSHFDEDGVPVVIAARNEESNIAATLASLAENNRASDTLVHPIVIENGSTDATAEIAHAMGATVLHSEPFKLAALQRGVSTLNNEGRLGGPVLFTDADSIVAPTWVNAMADVVKGESLAYAGGRSELDHGPSKASDILGNFALRAEDIAGRLAKKGSVTRGDNTALNFANDQDTIEWYLAQDPRRFVFEDSAIGEEFLARGARFVRTLGHEAVVSSLGDRYGSISERLRVVAPNGEQWLFKKYEKDYPGIVLGRRGQ